MLNITNLYGGQFDVYMPFTQRHIETEEKI